MDLDMVEENSNNGTENDSESGSVIVMMVQRELILTKVDEP